MHNVVRYSETRLYRQSFNIEIRASESRMGRITIHIEHLLVHLYIAVRR